MKTLFKGRPEIIILSFGAKEDTMSQFYSGNNEALLKKIASMNKEALQGVSLSDEQIIAEFVVELIYKEDFKLKKGGLSAGVKTLVCKICKGDQFTVGQDQYYTAVKCNECGYELGIHEG